MNADKIILTGVHLELTDAIKNIVTHKLEKLLRHGDPILKIRVELESKVHKHNPTEFVAKGHIDIQGPNIVAAVSTDNLYKSVDLLVDKLNRKLSRRHRLAKVKRKISKYLDIPAALPKVPSLQY